MRANPITTQDQGPHGHAVKRSGDYIGRITKVIHGDGFYADSVFERDQNGQSRPVRCKTFAAAKAHIAKAAAAD